MNKGISQASRRFWVIVNYLTLTIYLILFHYWEGMRSEEYVLLGITVAALVLMIISFRQVHVKTHLWILTHSKIEKLDEREIQLTHGSLRYAYAIFSIVCLSLMYANGIMDRGGFSALTVGCLVYFAHTLPSSVIAWSERKL